MKGLLLGRFAVNLLHSLTHLAIGVAGLALYRSFSGAKAYALALGIAYAGLFLLGVLSEPVGTLGVILPLNAPDDILHIATALVALGAYFASRRRDDVDARGSPRPEGGKMDPAKGEGHQLSPFYDPIPRGSG